MTLKNLLERFFPNSSDRQHFLTQPRKELNNKSPQSFLDAGKTETIRLFLARREREVLPT